MPDVILYAGEANPNDVRLQEPSYSSAFYPSVGQLSDCFRNVRIQSISTGNDGNLLAGYFDATLYRWTIPADRMGTGKVYRFDTNIRTFNPPPTVTLAWTIPAERMRSGFGPRADTNTDNAWMANLVPIVGWNAPTDSMARASGRWTPETNPDNAWITENLFFFDPAFFPAIAELVGVRTPTAASLAVAYYLALYDLGWLHDVIPLPDPVPGADVIYLRPIAPVMSARRRNKKRRR